MGSLRRASGLEEWPPAACRGAIVMKNVQILDPARPPRGGYKVDVSRGERNGRVSSTGPTMSAISRSTISGPR